MPKVTEARETPSLAEREIYWKSPWGEEAKKNESAEYLKGNRKGKLVIWVGCLYRLGK